MDRLRPLIGTLQLEEHVAPPGPATESGSKAEPGASQLRRSAVVDVALDAVIVIDSAGCALEFNPAAERTFGLTRERVLGHALVDLLVPERLREQARDAFARRAAGAQAPTSQRFDTFALHADGTEFPVEVAFGCLPSAESPLFALVVRDTTTRTRAERETQVHQERLRSLTADLLLAEERERRRLAVDLHDGLSQTIALMQIKLSALRRSKGTRLTAAVDELSELIDQTNRAVRSISFELSPPVLHDFGLVPALQWLVESLQARYGIEILLEDDGQPKPADEKVRVILFRSVRELLINSAKHARSHQIRVRLWRVAERLHAAVEDDGIGMEPDSVAVQGSGLFSIHERLEHVGGSMDIESAPGQGAQIHLCAPLTSGKPTRASVSP